ncbi:hypothetical protein BKA70DRAFT_1188627 [Coprinopsis sp. MPI-PUGE-AT-0042]|nr:hypothetical protein BKA70DRAFT_1188627 [Coprinopsis sp. MPI-PUGE-AT-0042]
MTVNPPPATESSATTPVSQESEAHTPQASQRRPLIEDYAGAQSDFGGSPAQTVYRTGALWLPGYRELRPASSSHPIAPFWDGFLHAAAHYLTEKRFCFNTIAGVAVANEGEDIFVPLVVVIGAPPDVATFEEAKSVADGIKSVILTDIGFGDVDVAIRQWTVTSAAGVSHSHLLRQSPLEPDRHPDFDVCRPFTSLLSLPISTLTEPHCEGNGAVYLKLENQAVLLVTGSHVVRSPEGPGFQNTEHTHDPLRNPIYAVSLGDKACLDAHSAIASRITTCNSSINSTEGVKIPRLRDLLASGRGNDDVPRRLTDAENSLPAARQQLANLQELQAEVREDNSLSLEERRRRRIIGHVVHADPIAAAPGDCTMDWAAIKLDMSFFDPHTFQGNKVYIGDKLRGEGDFESRMPCPHQTLNPKPPCRCAGYPVDGLLEITRLVSEADMQEWLREHARNDLEIPVLKHGWKTGTTVGRLNGLKTLVRHERRRYTDSLQFDSIEHTFLGSGGHAFSKPGDSGASIVDREGRLVGMITSGSGISDSLDLTYATPFYKILNRLEEVLPGYTLYPPINR